MSQFRGRNFRDHHDINLPRDDVISKVKEMLLFWIISGVEHFDIRVLFVCM